MISIRRNACIAIAAAIVLAAGAALSAGGWDQAVTSAALPEGWQLPGAPETAEGPALFALIDGGAELYMRHGFAKMLQASYRDRQGRRVEMEIYEMTDGQAARAVQAEKTGTGGRTLDVGDAALLEDYYINFRRGRFQVSLAGPDADPGTVAALTALARTIDGVLAVHVR